jgi:hypothetical protein
MKRTLNILMIQLAMACHLPKKYSPLEGSITYVCHSWCGGLADRIRGISAVYMYSLILNRSFHIEMPEMHLQEFLQPAENNAWNIPVPPSQQHYQAIDNPNSLQLCDWNRFEHISVSTNIWSPQPILTAMCPEWQTEHARQIVNSIFRAPRNAQGYILAFPCIGKTFRRLFRPSDALKARLRDERRRLLKSRRHVGLHFREGDHAMFPGDQDRRGHSIDKCLHMANTFFLSQDVYLVSDSTEIKTQHQNASIIVSPATPYHVDKNPYDFDKIMSVFVDLLMLSSMNAIVLTSSGFGALAALIGGYRPSHIKYC